MAENTPIIKICKVISIDDDTGMDRIKVKMEPDDNYSNSIENIPYAFPILPKNFFIKPKVGESVLVFSDTSASNEQRYFIGPIIPQLNKMKNNSHDVEARVYLRSSKYRHNKSPYVDTLGEGIYPETDDISIIGKDNTDIQLKDNDLRIRCGCRIPSNEAFSGFAFNSSDPAYIKLRYDSSPQAEKGSKSSINIVADKINLIGNNSNLDFKNGANDKKDLITDEEIKNFIEKAHEVPFGDILIEFLNMFREIFLHHTHPISNLPPCLSDKDKTNLIGFDLKTILSDTVRIN